MARPGVQRRRREPSAPPRQRWLGPALGVAVLAMLAATASAAYLYLSQPGRLPLRVIEVQGEFRHLQTARIQQTVVDAIDGGFFSCDMRRLRQAVLAMPWVADVSIRRVWPDRLSMSVREEEPLARWGDEALINTGAGVFVPPSLDGYAELARLHGPEGSEHRVVDFFRRAVAASDRRDLKLTELRQDERRHWWLVFEGGLVLSLGRDEVDRRFAQFLRVYPSLVVEPGRQPERIDMRYAHGFAVQWREQPAVVAPSEAVKLQDKV